VPSRAPHLAPLEGFEATPQALHDLLAGRHTGKVLVRYWQREGIGV